MKSLYEIDAELKQLVEDAEQQAIENDGEISLIMAMMLEQVRGEKEEKIGKICKYYKSLLAEAEMVKTESKALADRAKSAELKADSMKYYLSKFMKEGEVYSDSVSKISWRKSSVVDVFDPSLLTDEFTKVTIAPDKTKIKDAIKAGTEVPGAKIENKNNIQIK